MKKNILFSKDCRDKVRIGANLIADAVSVTLGPQGRNVLISESFLHDYELRSFPIRATKDGVSCARCVKSEDQLENVGVLLFREASEKTMLMAGDGTTSTLVLAKAILNSGLEMVEAGENPMELKKGIDEAVEYVVDKIKELSVPINGDLDKIRQIATIAANNDSHIGGLVASAFEKIGEDGVIDIEESKSVNTEVRINSGFRFNKGWYTNSVSAQVFVTNHAKGECEMIDPYILLYDRNILQVKQIHNILNQIVSENKPILIICDSVEAEALAFLTVNTAQKKIQACVVHSPFLGDEKAELMEDLAAATGGTFISDLKGVGIENVQLSHLGKAKKIIVSRESTVIVSGNKNEQVFDKLVSSLKTHMAAATSDDEKAKIEARLARLTGSVAIISVGGQTEVEMKEKKDRVDDSIRAAKSALAEGYVPGGGTAFLRVAKQMEVGLNKGFQIVGVSLLSTLRQICENAGVKDIPSIVNAVIDSEGNVGYNARTGKIEDLVEAGVIDPVKVLRCSLQNGASVSGMILTAEAMIVDSLN